MMNKFKFAYTKEVIGAFTFFAFVEGGLMLLFLLNLPKSSELFCFLFMPIPLVSLILLPYRKLFSQYRITGDGIENRRCKLKWNEIEDCTVLEPTILRRGHLDKKILSPVVCFGKISDGDFFHQNTKVCVFVPLTRLNLTLVREYNNGENKKINDLIDVYDDEFYNLKEK